MIKKIITLALATLGLLSVISCKKKKEQQPTPASSTPAPAPTPTPPANGSGNGNFSIPKIVTGNGLFFDDSKKSL